MKVPQLTITGLATAALVAGGMALAGLGLAVYPVDAKAAPFSADEWCPPQAVPRRSIGLRTARCRAAARMNIGN